MIIKPSKKLYVGLIILIGMAGFAVMRSGIFSKSQPVQGMPQVVEVKAMQVIQRDTSINYEYVGKVTSKDEVKIMSKISGSLSTKLYSIGRSDI